MTPGRQAGIAFVVDSLRFGGAEKHTVGLFNRLDPARFRPGLVYLKKEEHILPEVDPACGPVFCPDFGRGWDFAGLRRLSNWLHTFDPDLLVCVNTYPLFYGFLARRMVGGNFPITEIYHSTQLHKRDDWQMRLVYRHFFNRSDRIIYVSHAQRAYWEARGVHSGRAAVIHNGVNAEHYQDAYSGDELTALRALYGFDPKDFLVGICAALRPEKQHEDLLEAIALLRAGGLSAKCLIIGDGLRRSAIEARSASLGLERHVVITGFKADVRAHIAACDCMAIVSHQVETFSIAALESMALGKPMVMSAIGGAEEQVREGDNGYLFPAGDVEALAKALRKQADPVRRAEMGSRARQRVVEEFSLQGMLDKYALLFEQCAGTARQ